MATLSCIEVVRTHTGQTGHQDRARLDIDQLRYRKRAVRKSAERADLGVVPFAVDHALFDQGLSGAVDEPNRPDRALSHRVVLFHSLP